MKTNDLIVNLICLKVGIVPFGGGTSGHIVNSLESLSPRERRRATRKFRKFLKKAIHREACFTGAPGSEGYRWKVKMLREATGLDPDGSVRVFSLGANLNDVFDKQKITTSQSNLRALLVREYLLESFDIDS